MRTCLFVRKIFFSCERANMCFSFCELKNGRSLRTLLLRFIKNCKEEIKWAESKNLQICGVKVLFAFISYLSSVATNVRNANHGNYSPISTAEDSKRERDNKHSLYSVGHIPCCLKLIDFFVRSSFNSNKGTLRGYHTRLSVKKCLHKLIIKISAFINRLPHKIGQKEQAKSRNFSFHAVR